MREWENWKRNLFCNEKVFHPVNVISLYISFQTCLQRSVVCEFRQVSLFFLCPRAIYGPTTMLTCSLKNTRSYKDVCILDAKHLDDYTYLNVERNVDTCSLYF